MIPILAPWQWIPALAWACGGAHAVVRRPALRHVLAAVALLYWVPNLVAVRAARVLVATTPRACAVVVPRSGAVADLSRHVLVLVLFLVGYLALLLLLLVATSATAWMWGLSPLVGAWAALALQLVCVAQALRAIGLWGRSDRTAPGWASGGRAVSRVVRGCRRVRGAGTEIWVVEQLNASASADAALLLRAVRSELAARAVRAVVLVDVRRAPDWSSSYETDLAVHPHPAEAGVLWNAS